MASVWNEADSAGGQASDLADLAARLQASLARLALDPQSLAFAYASCDSLESGKGGVLAVSRPAAWTEDLGAAQALAKDPLVAAAAARVLPFAPSDLGEACGSSELCRRAAALGLAFGLCVPVHGPGSVVGIFLVAAAGGAAAGLPMAARHEIHLLARQFHGAALRLAKGQALPALSPREIECLGWVAQGKTAWEISRILEVSEATVVFHLRNAVRKLGAENRRHAVAKATHLGFIDL